MITNFKLYISFLIIAFTSALSIGQQLHKLKPYELVELQLIDQEHTNKFEKLQVQDFQGRIKPIQTLALDLNRKLTGKSDFKYFNAQGKKEKLNATQVFLGMHYRSDAWQLIPCIKVDKETKDTIAKIIPVNKEGYAKPAQFYDFNRQYKLKKLVDDAYAKAEGKRGTLDKNIIKLDERVNIIFAIFSGQFLRIFPNQLDGNNKWAAPKEPTEFLSDQQEFYHRIIPTYLEQLKEGNQTKDWTKANTTIEILEQFQQNNGGENLIPSNKIDKEISYNNQKIFFKSMMGYTIVGFLLLIFSFIDLFYSKKWIKTINNIGWLITALTFGYHFYGILLRWYISGHAPWSNGFEATVFIASITVLAGLLFSKKSKLPAAATALIAVCLLGIAHGNLMNPEITNLVPVLKSYWLMIHVAIITGSYGFLTMGSLLALLVLVSFNFITPENQNKIIPKIKELTAINEKTTNIGLFMLTVGTFLGGVWANESWGRYWGWDPKETWALISIIIYAFVLHIKMIFKNNHLITYNICSLFALGSLVMTFFGVNYYLSGLHSYAAGDSFPIPKWIFIVIPLLIIISILAKFKSNKLKKSII